MSGNDLKEIETSREYLLTKGTQGVSLSLAGAGILILNAVIGGIPGLILGGLFAFGGFSFKKKSETESDKKASNLLIVAGSLTVIASLPIPALAPLASFLLLGSGITLLVNGGYNIYKFFKGNKKRRES